MAPKQKAAASKDTSMPRSLTWLRFQIISTILELKDEAYTNAVRRSLNERLGTAYELGQVHITLDRMHKSGLLATYPRDGVTSLDGSVRSVVVYQPTEAGSKLYEISKPFHTA